MLLFYNGWPDFSSGAGHQLLDIMDHVSAGHKIKDVEKRVSIENLGDRIYDFVVEIGDETIKYEKKAWSAKNINGLLSSSMKKNVKTNDEINELPGQLFKDLVQLNKEAFCCTRWSFDARAADYPNGAAGIGNKIVELANKNEASLRKVMNMRDNDIGQSQWDKFIEELTENTAKIVEVKTI